MFDIEYTVLYIYKVRNNSLVIHLKEGDFYKKVNTSTTKYYWIYIVCINIKIK